VRMCAAFILACFSVIVYSHFKLLEMFKTKKFDIIGETGLEDKPILPKDIQDRLHLDFKQEYDLAAKLLSDLYIEMSTEYGDFKSFRIHRCIIYLAAGNLNKLNNCISGAKSDFRDIIVAAEYDNEDNQVRDFIKPFY
jgi:hypothetical protein